MALKNWFRGNKEPEGEVEFTVDELIVMERFEDARALLNERIRYYPKDRHAHLKLAEVYLALKDADSCQQEYMHVASAYAEDGFYDKARAVLMKLHRLFPADIDVDLKMEALQRAKRLEHTRGKARAGLLSTSSLDNPLSGRMAVEFESIWGELTRTSLVDRISSDDFARVFAAVEILEVAPGGVLVEAGSAYEVLFIIAKGSIEARGIDLRGHHVTLRAFGAGDIIGERSLLSHAPWAAQYRCLEKAKVL